MFFLGGCRLCARLLTRTGRLPICDDCLAAFPVLQARVCGKCGSPSVPETLVAAGSNLSAATVGETGAAPGGGLVCGECIRRNVVRLNRRGATRRFERYWFEQFCYRSSRGWIRRRFTLRSRTGRTADIGDLVSGKAKRMRLPHKPVLQMPLKLGRTSTYSSHAERSRAVRGAFATRPGSQVDNKRVLLLDDVVTTGATLEACAKVLLEAGAKSVVGVTVARVVKRAMPGSMSEF